jgi:Fe2+ or Zn2+ uptake regulation protein
VITALTEIGRPVSHKEVHEWLKKKRTAINLVTVYRILEKFETLGLVHKQPTSGGFVLCALSAEHGHHGFLSCQQCGTVEEFADPDLCRVENAIARKAGFIPASHLSEIVGICSTCHAA